MKKLPSIFLLMFILNASNYLHAQYQTFAPSFSMNENIAGSGNGKTGNDVSYSINNFNSYEKPVYQSVVFRGNSSPGKTIIISTAVGGGIGLLGGYVMGGMADLFWVIGGYDTNYAGKYALIGLGMGMVSGCLVGLIINAIRY